MKVVFTEDALRDLDEILRFIGRNYPTISLAFEKRLHTLLERPVRNYLIVYEVGRDEACVGARGKRNDTARVRRPTTLSAHGRGAQGA
jgi:plasmid stabilization system protein ParE